MRARPEKLGAPMRRPVFDPVHALAPTTAHMLHIGSSDQIVGLHRVDLLRWVGATVGSRSQVGRVTEGNDRSAQMQRLWIKVPGLSMKQDFKAARERLMNDFPMIEDVIATTAPETVLIVASDPIDVDAWQETLRSVS